MSLVTFLGLVACMRCTRWDILLQT